MDVATRGEGSGVDELPIGRRVAYWRSRRRMSQQVFADRLGKSKSWVDKIERGVRRLDKFSVVYEIADVLQVDVQLLLGRDAERRPGSINCIDQIEVEEIRSALERYDQMSAFFTGHPDRPPLEELRKAVGHAWLTFQHAKYGVLARTLPRLLREAQAADTGYASGEQALDAAHLLGQVYQIASSTLRKLGEHELAWLAADRSIAVSQRSGDQLLAAIATYRVGSALLALGRARPALEVNVNVANRLAPGTEGTPTTPDRLSVYGMLLLNGAMAAARIGDGATVRDLIRGADDAATALGGDQNHYWTSFGPTNVQLHRAAAAVELGEGAIAVETHERLDPDGFTALLPERRAHHYIDLARGLAQVGDVERASEMLLEGDRLAPSEIRCRPIAHEVLSDVLRRIRGTPSAPVAELAENMGVGA
jgi:transcriptional regulator with XRE-family HTH domain